VIGKPLKLFIALLLGTALSHAPSAHACAACFGASDSELAKGMNMGIFVLLGVIVFVLGAIASFFIFLARRAGTQSTGAISELTKQIS
jgi:hypothetical protein